MTPEVIEKPWYLSKKFWVWLISFTVLASIIVYGLYAEADPGLLKVAVRCLTVISAVGILGQAGVDAAVRFAKVWRGAPVIDRELPRG